MPQFPQDPHGQTSKPGLSTGAKVGIGCAAAFVLVVILVCAGAITWWFVTWGPYQEFGDEFEALGYTRRDSTAISIETPQTGPLVLVGRVVNVEADIDGNLAVASMAANIEGTINGDLDFFGLVLNIERGAHITGDVRVRSAQAVNVEGIIDGELTGTWQALSDQRRQPPPPPPSAPPPQDDPDAQP